MQETPGSFLQFFAVFLLFFVCCWEIPEFGERSFSLFFAVFCRFSLFPVRAIKHVPLSALLILRDVAIAFLCS